VSLGATTTTVPDVTGEDEESARSILQNDGWRVVVRDTTTDIPDEDGTVTTQDPAPGSEAEPGSRVIIYVARYQAPPQPPPSPEPPPSP
jgi:serine/threonine-protein kinase